MSHPEIRNWLFEKGYTTGEIEKIIAQIDQYDSQASRESLFDDLASGAFDIEPIIAEALKDK